MNYFFVFFFFLFDNAFALFHFSTSPIFLRIFLGCEIQILAEWNFHVKSDLASTPLAMLNFRDAAKVKYKPKKKNTKKILKKSSRKLQNEKCRQKKIILRGKYAKEKKPWQNGVKKNVKAETFSQRSRKKNKKKTEKRRRHYPMSKWPKTGPKGVKDARGGGLTCLNPQSSIPGICIFNLDDLTTLTFVMAAPEFLSFRVSMFRSSREFPALHGWDGMAHGYQDTDALKILCQPTFVFRVPESTSLCSHAPSSKHPSLFGRHGADQTSRRHSPAENCKVPSSNLSHSLAFCAHLFNVAMRIIKNFIRIICELFSVWF